MEMDRTQRQRRRLQDLIAEAGTQEKLAEKVGTAESYISQLMTARNGIARKFCERLEKAMQKPDGWMDQWLPEELDVEATTGQPLTDTEQRLLGMWRYMTPTVKRYSFSQMMLARMTPDLTGTNNLTEEDINRIIGDALNDDGTPKTPR